MKDICWKSTHSKFNFALWSFPQSGFDKLRPVFDIWSKGNFATTISFPEDKMREGVGLGMSKRRSFVSSLTVPVINLSYYCTTNWILHTYREVQTNEDIFYTSFWGLRWRNWIVFSQHTPLKILLYWFLEMNKTSSKECPHFWGTPSSVCILLHSNKKKKKARMCY